MNSQQQAFWDAFKIETSTSSQVALVQITGRGGRRGEGSEVWKVVELLNAAHKQDGQIRRKKSEIIAQSVDVSLGDTVPITEEPGEKRPELPLEATTTKKNTYVMINYVETSPNSSFMWWISFFLNFLFVIFGIRGRNSLINPLFPPEAVHGSDSLTME